MSLRFGVEFMRKPDTHLGLIALWLVTGQWLSAAMVLVGTALLAWEYRGAQRPTPNTLAGPRAARENEN